MFAALCCNSFCRPLDYRPITVQTGVLATTNGSARVQLASTDLLIGVKAELVSVENISEYRNRINFFVDCSANATPLFAGELLIYSHAQLKFKARNSLHMSSLR